ncbi:hypothetical protein [Pseudomonas sp. SWRI179]|uniref:hypothetical protein n=1 Tax=Pseudomonas sp. SWRI179 TaxID=2745497 RepID=UPI0016449E0F|nr:hypothetical protein [Pseudomonas sp. SWRI179]MBC3383003.1 hypothetical protein [Pseudomonas sp. SWRI179]
MDAMPVNDLEKLWELSLLAMAAAHSTSMQADPPLSRAGSLPQGFGMDVMRVNDLEKLWELSLLAMAVAHSTSMQADPPLSRASSVPTGVLGVHSFCIHHKSQAASLI